MSGRLIIGDCREVLATLPDQSVQCCVTSPPYFGLRDYGMAAQIGLESTPEAYVAEMVAVFREVRRVLRDDGTLWLNLGDSYAGGGTIGRKDTTRDVLSRRARDYGTGAGAGSAVGTQGSRPLPPGSRPKDLLGIPWRVAFALQADGWYLRQDIIWHKPNPLPESVKDRCTKAHEYVFLLTKSSHYYFDAKTIAEQGTNRPPGSRASNKHIAAALTDPKARTKGNLHKIGAVEYRNRRSVWTIAPHPFKGAHFATFPPALVEPCVLAGCPEKGTVLDPFAGAGTTGLVAVANNRDALLLEINAAYGTLILDRFASAGLPPLNIEMFQWDA